VVLAGLKHRAVTAGLTAVLGGCFAADDFSACRRSEECGAGAICAQGVCESLFTPDAEAPPTAAPTSPPSRTDAGPPPADCTQEVVRGRVASLRVECPDGTVTIEDVLVEDSGGQSEAPVSIIAREIIIVGRLDASGAGGRGGGGGGGGAGGGRQAVALPGGGGVGHSIGASGGAPTNTLGGAGGTGGAGQGQGAGRGGVPGSDANAGVGQPGLDGQLVDPTLETDAARAAVCAPGAQRPGSGGGGGGGGRGGDGDACLVGGGGGGGGAGSPGGGLIVLQASERIILRGEVLAVGRASTDLRAPPARATAACGADEPCGVECAVENGTGARGGDAGNRGQLGGDGGDGVSEPVGGLGGPGGPGGAGGGGSGGMIRFTAPEIVWEGGARVDVSGSAGETNGGAVIRAGRETGEPPNIVGDRYACETVPFSENP
jgi:hypothetical protein